MRLEEAIRHGERKVEQGVFQVDPEAFEALKILVEAGKRVVWHKGQHLDGYYELLPGETKE